MISWLWTSRSTGPHIPTPVLRLQTLPHGRRFAELAALLEVGKVVRTDKLSIIADAVKEVTKLRAESHQLRQLNKFLEVWPCTCMRLHAYLHGVCCHVLLV